MPIDPGAYYAAAKSCHGLTSKIPGLIDKLLTAIGRTVPNGDTDKLAHIAGAWTDFAKHPAIKNAPAQLTSITNGLQHIGAPDITDLAAHLSTLNQGAA